MTRPRKALPRWPRPLRARGVTLLEHEPPVMFDKVEVPAMVWLGQCNSRPSRYYYQEDEVRLLVGWLTRWLAAYDARQERP